MGRHYIVAALLYLVLAPTPALAAPASCADYLGAADRDRSLFDGFIYGFVSAKFEKGNVEEVADATKLVRAMTDKFCTRRPQETVAPVIATFVDLVLKMD